MDRSLLIADLNDAQRLAVCAPAGSNLVLAGAGSGKTRVLVRRIAWLIATEGCLPEQVLAVTFTNKAATEMRGRVEQLLERPAAGLWIGTFHGIAHRFLRRHYAEAGLPNNFQILDADDQVRLIRRLLRALELDEKRWPARQLAGIIGRAKDEAGGPDQFASSGDPYSRTIARVFAAYEEACQRTGLVDFAELLLRSYRLWRENTGIRRHYQSQFKHLLVDEFQDTNTLQYLWLRALSGDKIRPFVVGDDDQSIYGWRGARVENVERFRHDFAPVKIIRLEQNYRSTGNILSAANAVISRNQSRMGKNLWTSGQQGDLIDLYAATDEANEAEYVISSIERWVTHEEGNLAGAAILYRSNAQSRVFEEVLIREGIPYRVYGGLRFFERSEIKDTLAYLRLILNPSDDAAFERIINTPSRGIGPRTLAAVRDCAREHRTPLHEAACRLVETAALTTRPRQSLERFLHLIKSMAEETAPLPLQAKIEQIIDKAQLRAHYLQEGPERGQSRLENLDELISAATGFVPEAGIEPLASFLSQATLESGEQQAGAGDTSVQLMTLHAAKGLEFPLVFLTGMEDGLFPHQKCLDNPAALEEERRLFYVGMTRAREKLVLTHAEKRRLHGQMRYGIPSRFLSEIPVQYLSESGPRRQYATHAAHQLREDSQFGLGKRVFHDSFGEGIILGQEGEGSHLRLQVRFEQAGTKWLVAAFANLQSL